MPLPKFMSASAQPLTTAAELASGGAPTPAPLTHLNLNMQRQLQTNWCWSAVSVSVKLFYAPGFPITQCDQANRVLQQTRDQGAMNALARAIQLLQYSKPSDPVNPSRTQFTYGVTVTVPCMFWGWKWHW